MGHLARLPEHEIEKITHLNVMRHFRHDPSAHTPRGDATAAAGWDVSVQATAHL
jgi:hypothetical protein